MKTISIATNSHRQSDKVRRSFKLADTIFLQGISISLGSKTRTWHVEDTAENRQLIERLGLHIHAKETARQNLRFAECAKIEQYRLNRSHRNY